jgi:hypothetical protein
MHPNKQHNTSTTHTGATNGNKQTNTALTRRGWEGAVVQTRNTHSIQMRLRFRDSMRTNELTKR